jgi:hypothetical protein
MHKSVEKWRSLVESELARGGYPFPPEHILSIMFRESRGNPRAISNKGAVGLMQVMPIALKDYNRNHKHSYTMTQLKASPQIQVRVGTWILGSFVKSAYRYLKKRVGRVALDDLIRIADTFYATGPKWARARLDKLDIPTWDNVRARFPNWDRVRPAELVWERANEGGAVWSFQSIDRWLVGHLSIDQQKTAGGAILGLLVVVAAWFWFKKRKK